MQSKKRKVTTRWTIAFLSVSAIAKSFTCRSQGSDAMWFSRSITLPSIAVFFCSLLCAPFLLDSGYARAEDQSYVPDLGDLMEVTQLRHFKLWYAGRSKNWALASYEVGQIRKSFEAAAKYYPKFAGSDIAEMIRSESYGPLDGLKAAIERHDSADFGSEFKKLTDACNECHRATKFDFLKVRVPTASPFSNQLFPPRGRP